jgi:hypothetical protein
MCAFFHQLVAELRDVVQILRSGPRGISFKACQPVADVSGIADLAHLAVADDVDSNIGLLPNHIGDGGLHHIVKHAGLVGFASILRE